MPVTMTWNLVSEQAPAHQESIIWLRVSSSFDFYGFEPREVDVDYQWSEIDEQGYDTGSAFCYEDGDEDQKGCRLVMCVAGYELQPSDLWMPQGAYYKFLAENIPNLAELEGK